MSFLLILILLRRLQSAQLSDPLLRQRQQGIQLLGAKRHALSRALNLDEAAFARHHHVHIGVAVRILVVIQIKHRYAADHADRNRRDRVNNRALRDFALRM